MYVSKQVLAWVFVAGGGVVGWLLFLSSPDEAPPAPAVVAAAAESPTARLDRDVRISIVTPESGKAEKVGKAEVVAEPVPVAAPASLPGGDRSVPQELVVRASDGAIVYVGDDGTLNANTGETAASGSVVIDSVDSTLTTGDSGEATADGSPMAAEIARAPGATVSDQIAPRLAGRAVAISGYEDHSVNVAGNDQIATYDDSNVFIGRSGQINANTGDTDSSGLNAVDVVRSSAGSGDSADAPPGEDPDDPDEPDDPDDPEEPEEPDGENRSAASAPADTAPSSDGSTTAGPVTRGSGDSASVTDDDGGTAATGRDPLVIGGDGYDDLGIRSAGNRNIVTYDDSNLVVGGTGKVNAQIGDSDTAGAVVMGIADSQVQAGDAF